MNDGVSNDEPVGDLTRVVSNFHETSYTPNIRSCSAKAHVVKRAQMGKRQTVRIERAFQCATQVGNVPFDDEHKLIGRNDPDPF